MWPFISTKKYKSEIVETIKEIDRYHCVKYMTEQLKALHFEEYAEGCFVLISDRTFKVAFSCGKSNECALPMVIIHDPKGDDKWKKYPEYLNIYSISQIQYAYTQLTGKPL